MKNVNLHVGMKIIDHDNDFRRIYKIEDSIIYYHLTKSGDLIGHYQCSENYFFNTVIQDHCKKIIPSIENDFNKWLLI